MMYIISLEYKCWCTKGDKVTILASVYFPRLVCSSIWYRYNHTVKQLRVSATTPLPFWTYYMSWAHSITTPCTRVNNTSCNKPKVVPEPEIPALRGKEWQSGLGTLEVLAVWDIMWNYRLHIYCPNISTSWWTDTWSSKQLISFMNPHHSHWNIDKCQVL